MMNKILYSLIFVTALFSQTLLADEVWNSTFGQVVYEAEVGTTAVWSYNWQGKKSWIYINDLAGIYEGRGFYQGYWVQSSSDVKCKTPRKMENNTSYYWGTFEIQFLDPNFPSRWAAKWSYCNKKPTENWTGTPI